MAKKTPTTPETNISSDYPPTERTSQEVDLSIPTGSTAPDPFDLGSLRLNPSFLETAGVKKLTTTVPARKAGKQEFVRVHRSPDYRENFAMIDLKDDREDFLVRPELLPELASEVSLQDDLHGDQPAGRLLSLAGPPAGTRRSAVRLAAFGAGSRGSGDGPVDSDRWPTCRSAPTKYFRPRLSRSSRSGRNSRFRNSCVSPTATA